MANFNKVMLMGNLTRDPELRYTPSGTPVCEFGLATNRTYTTRDGEQREEPCFVDITMWGRRGVVISEYFTKGDPIFVEGRLQYDSWETPDGSRRSKLRVVAENFEFLGSTSGGGGASRGRSAERRDRASERGRGGSGDGSQAEPEEEETYDVGEDEIPF